MSLLWSAAAFWRRARGMECTRGAVPYLGLLDHLHRELRPSHYLEIGVQKGKSLRLARGLATGVDPAPAIEYALPATTQVIALTSDAFFASVQKDFAPDFCFIDGLHLIEFALRDFMNIERCAAPGAVVIIDDIFPTHPVQALRKRKTRAWTGDVWRIVAILRRWRPDLFLLPIDTSPAGLLLVCGLDRANRILWKHFDVIVGAAREPRTPPSSILDREGAISSRDRLRHVIDVLKDTRRFGISASETVRRLRS